MKQLNDQSLTSLPGRTCAIKYTFSRCKESASVADHVYYSSGKVLTIKLKLKQELIEVLQVGVCNLLFFKIFMNG